ncbi:MAG: MATE family efflux transporter [Clostridiaceae bacterium]|nr:MATE family efflux transporter [Clostridiaceae bacterium]
MNNTSNRKNKLHKKDIKNIIEITWPAFIELVMSTLFGMVDMVMVGRVSAAAIAAVGLTNQPFMLLMAVFAAVNVGTTTLVAWNIGSENTKDAKAVARQTIIINLILGIVMSLLGIFTARSVILFMGGNEDTLELGIQYFQIVSAGLVFQSMNAGITAALRGAGETKIPMVYNVGANLLNVFGNYILIYGKLGLPAMGVAGAALSTTISRLIACLAGLYTIFFSRKTIMKLSVKDNFRCDKNIIKQIFSIGLPSALEQFVLQSGLMLFARTVSELGTNAFAAHQIGVNINGLSFAPGMAFGVAATTLVGQSLGANDRNKAEQYARTIHKISVCVGLFIGLIFILFSHPLARVYNSDADVVSKAGTVLKLVALGQAGIATQLPIAGALRGAGDTRFPLYASATGIWVFRVAFSYIFVNVLNWGLMGAWLSLILDQYTRATIVYIRFRTGKWKYIRS